MPTKRWALILLAIGIAFWFPLTRAAILFVLPLGSGVDDIIFVVALLLGGLLWSKHKAQELPPITRRRRIWLITVAFIFLLAAFLYWIGA